MPHLRPQIKTGAGRNDQRLDDRHSRTSRRCIVGSVISSFVRRCLQELSPVTRSIPCRRRPFVVHAEQSSPHRALRSSPRSAATETQLHPSIPLAYTHHCHAPSFALFFQPITSPAIPVPSLSHPLPRASAFDGAPTPASAPGPLRHFPRCATTALHPLPSFNHPSHLLFLLHRLLNCAKSCPSPPLLNSERGRPGIPTVLEQLPLRSPGYQ